MIEKDILEVLNNSELIDMCRSHFDSDTVKQGIEEIKNALLIKLKFAFSEFTYNDLVDYFKTKPKDYYAVIQVQPHDSNNIYTIEVFLYDKDKIGIVGDFSQEYEMDELEILSIIK